MKHIYFLTLIITLIAFNAKSQTHTAHLKETNFFPGSNPKGIFDADGTLMFSANVGSGIEPYKYNIQTKEAALVQNINNSLGDSMQKNEFYKINNKIYFFASDNSNFQLWSTDLSNNTTSKIKDFNSYFSSSDNIVAKVFNNKLFIVFKQKLYVSDGSTVGTYELNNVSSVSNYLYESNGFVFFFANTGSFGKEICKTDGTVQGTSIVKDINNGSNSSIIGGYEKMYSFNNKIVFVALDHTNNLGLWSTDGTAAGTNSFFLLNNYSPNFYDFDYENYNKLLFRLNGDLWKTDGTSGGTSLVQNNIPAISSLVYFKNKTYINTNDAVYQLDQLDQLTTLNNPSNTNLQALAVSDKKNYLILKETSNDFSPLYFFDGFQITQTDIKYAGDNKFVEHSNILYFSGFDKSYVEFYSTYKNTELFYYKPSDYSFGKEKDLSYGSAGNPIYFTKHNGEVFFLAQDGYYFQVYKKDVNQNIIKLSNDFQEVFSENIGDVNFTIESGNYIYFTGNNLIRTDGSSVNTKVIAPPANEKIYGTYSLNENQILVKTFNSLENYMRIWRLDNTSTTFVKLLEQPTMTYTSFDYDIDYAKTDSGIYFKMLNNASTELWKSDGTLQNTVKITDISNIYPYKIFLGQLNNKILFSDNQNFSYNNTKLYYVDKNSNQVHFVKDSYYFIDGKSFIKNNLLYFFSATGNGFISQLNVTDGTLQNTHVVSQINTEGAYAITKCGDLNYFVDYHRQKLFRTDGTSSGTFMIANNAQNYTKLNCGLNNELYGLNSLRKIFKTNGTVGGYQELSFTINNQPLQPQDYLWMKNMYTDNDKLFFAMGYKNHGDELFITDLMGSLGTEEGNSKDRQLNKILIYPNPAKSEINIELKNSEQISKIILFDATGKIISTHSRSQINVSNISEGVYFVKVITNSSQYTGKFIKIQ